MKKCTEWDEWNKWNKWNKILAINKTNENAKRTTLIRWRDWMIFINYTNEVFGRNATKKCAK